MHRNVDAQRWVKQYPLFSHFDTLDAQASPDFWYYQPSEVTSPKDLALTLQMREGAGMPGEPSSLVDVLVPAIGEPDRPEASKIGGRPFRSDRPWPRDANDKPMLFMGQLCFADSLDVLPSHVTSSLPGDLLLIFLEDCDSVIWNEHEGAALLFEWEQSGRRNQAPTDQFRDAPQPWEPFHFERLRSRESESRAEIHHGTHAIEVCGHWHSTKIGGIPTWIQSEEEGEGLGTFIAAINSMVAVGDDYPLVNMPKAPPSPGPYRNELLMFGDMGTLYLFWDGTRVRWLMQCG